MVGHFIYFSNGRVADVKGGGDSNGQDVIAWKRHGGLNQQWTIQYVEDAKPDPKKGQLNKDFGLYVERPFYIVSQMRRHRYLESNGRNIYIKNKNGRDSQVWWFDQRSKTIKSKQFGRSFDIQGAGKTANMQIWSTNSGWFQQFKYVDQNLMNIKDSRVVDVAGGRDSNGQNVIVWRRHNGPNQRWKIIYLDTIKVQVEYNGAALKADTPFQFVSQMKGHRLLTMNGTKNNFIIQQNNNLPQQTFMYDSKSNTIVNLGHKGMSLEISEAGRGRNLQASRTRRGLWNQRFNFDPKTGHITNERGLLVEVYRSRDRDGQNAVAWKANTG